MKDKEFERIKKEKSELYQWIMEEKRKGHDFSLEDDDWAHVKKLAEYIKLTEQIESENKIRHERLMRKEANSKRAGVVESGDGQCYICRMDNWNLLEVHHIVPIKEGGDSSIDNMIPLCPNCHAIVHNYMSAVNSDNGSKDARWCMEDWVNENWSINQYDRFLSICMKYIQRR